MFRLPAPVPPARLPQDGLLQAVQVGNGYNLHQNGFSLPVTLIHAEEIKAGLYRVEQSFVSDEGGLLSYLKDSLNTLNSLQRVYQPAKELTERMESAYIELKDISHEVSSQSDSVEFNPVRLEEVNERLNLIYSLQQKHRAQTLDELIALTDEYRSKLSDITSYDERIAELTVRKEEQYKQVKQQAELLTKARTKAAREVEKQLAARLIPLGMPNVRFQIEMGLKKEPGLQGEDTVNFLFSANKNGTLQNISSVQFQMLNSSAFFTIQEPPKSRFCDADS